MSEDGEWLRWKAFTSVAAVPLGFGAAVGVAFYLGEHGEALTTGAAAWVQAIGSIAAIVGSVAVVHHQQRLNTSSRHRTAAQIVAAQLRAWINSCMDRYYDHKNAVKSDGTVGKLIKTIPTFPFEQSFDRIADLRPDVARAVFELIGLRRSSISLVESVADYVDGEEAEKVLLVRLLECCVFGEPICMTLHRELGWDYEADPDIKVELDQQEALLAKRRKLTQGLPFVDG